MSNLIDSKLIENTSTLLLSFLEELTIEVIGNTLGLYSIEMAENGNTEIIFYYYIKNQSFASTDSFQYPNEKNYRKLIVDKNGKLLKITSKI